MLRNRIVFIAIFIFGIVFRFIYINQIPPSLTNDEVNIAINAQSILNTGSNIPGVVTGVIGKTSGDLYAGIHSELSSYFIIPFIKLFGFNIFGIKLPFIVASLGIMILGYFITKKLFNENVGLVVFGMLSINPWLIFYGRSAYESIFATFFYFLAIYLILTQNGFKKLYSIPFLVFGFMSYFSAKTLVIPLTIVASFGSFLFNRTKNIKSLIALNITIIFLVAVYGLILSKTPAGSRIKELKSQNISQMVIEKRTQSLDSPVSNLFENKIIEDLRLRITATTSMLNFNYLFLTGKPESTPSLSIPDHAFIYIIDFIFVLIGLFALNRKYPKHFLFFLGIIASTFIPNFLDLQGTTFSIRTVVLFPILTIISGIGIYSVYEDIRNNKYKLIFKYLTVFIYLTLFANFAYIYFSRIPVERGEGWFFSERLTSKYVSLSQSKNPGLSIIVIANEPKHAFYRYLLFSGKYTDKKSIEIINTKIANRDYRINNLKFIDNCQIDNNNATYLIDTNSNCKNVAKNTSIKSIKDGGDRYLILNDRVCDQSQKNDYPLIKDVNLLNIEKMSTANFCLNYVSRQ